MKRLDTARSTLRAAKGPKAKKKASAELQAATAEVERLSAGTVTSKMPPSKADDDDDDDDDGDDDEDEDEEDEDEDEEEEEDEDEEEEEEEDEDEDEDEEDEEEEKSAKSEEEKCAKSVKSLKRKLASAHSAKAKAAARTKLVAARAKLAAVRAHSARRAASSSNKLASLVAKLTGERDPKRAIGRLAAIVDANKTLVSDVKKLKASHAKNRLDALVERGRRSKKITPGNEKAIREMASQYGYEAAKAMVTAMTPALGPDYMSPLEEEGGAALLATPMMLKLWASVGHDVKDPKVVQALLAEHKTNLADQARILKGN